MAGCRSGLVKGVCKEDQCGVVCKKKCPIDIRCRYVFNVPRIGGCVSSPQPLRTTDDEPTVTIQLARETSFPAFFITQSLGAFNDNIFKQSLILAILYKLSIDGDRSIYVNLCALLFILPFFLFSALAGQFGEKYPKDKLIRIIKFAEIVVMAVGAAGFLFNHLELMLAALFAMGTHSALFGPVKYSILPQHLRETELVGGNALVEMGTFLAILAGTISAGVMMSSSHYGWIVSAAIVLVACLGFVSSFGIPNAAAASPEMKLNWNIFTQSWATLRMGLGQTPAVSRSIVGNSWFWFVGAIYLTQIPAYAKGGCTVTKQSSR